MPDRPLTFIRLSIYIYIYTGGGGLQAGGLPGCTGRVQRRAEAGGGACEHCLAWLVGLLMNRTTTHTFPSNSDHRSLGPTGPPPQPPHEPTTPPYHTTKQQGMRGVGAQQRTLLSNRAAAYEKLGDLAKALDDCARILREVCVYNLYYIYIYMLYYIIYVCMCVVK